MTREYLVVYAKSPGSNFAGCALDVLGCVSAGDTLEEMHAMMREALESHFSVMVDHGELIPAPAATSINFEEFDPGHETKQFVVEWLPVSLPHHVTA
jgi:predicted RNase H-like HicB family nuclease